MTGSAMGNLEDMKRFLDSFNRHDVEGILSFFAEEGVFQTTGGEGPAGLRLTGKDAIGEYFTKMFATMSSTHFGEDTHWLSADGQRGVSQWALSGTNTDGSKINVRGCDLFRMREGKIVLKDSCLKQIRRQAVFPGGKALHSPPRDEGKQLTEIQ